MIAEEIIAVIRDATNDTKGWHQSKGPYADARAVYQRLLDKGLLIVSGRFEPTIKRPGDHICTSTSIVRQP